MSPTPAYVRPCIDEANAKVPIGFTLLCATMLIFITPLWRTLRASVSLVVTFLITHTGLYRLWVHMTGNSASFEQTAAAMTKRWKAGVKKESWTANVRSATPDAREMRREWAHPSERTDRTLVSDGARNYLEMLGGYESKKEKGKGRAGGDDLIV